MREIYWHSGLYDYLESHNSATSNMYAKRFIVFFEKVLKLDEYEN